MRTALIEMLAQQWRTAENIYLETGSDSDKRRVKKLQDKQNLTEEETEELENTLNSMGV